MQRIAREGSPYIRATGKRPEGSVAPERANSFLFRESLGAKGGVGAMKAYDAYVKEHRRRLRQLEREARGEMAPSEEWYDE